MSKRKKYRPKPIASWLPPEQRRDIEIIGHYFAPKLAAGMFDDMDGNTLAFALNVAHKMAVDTGYQAMINMADVAMQSFLGIRQRRERVGKWGAAGEELLILEEHLPNIASWFITRPVHRIESARKWVYEQNDKMIKAGVLFADIADDGRLENTVKAA